MSVLSPGGTETFGIRVSQVTQFDQILTGIPILGLVVSPVISTLQQLPILSNLLAPIIGQSTVATYTANPSQLNSVHPTIPLAYTAKITYFDGTLISTKFFPASGVAVGTPAPTILNGPGIGYAGGPIRSRRSARRSSPTWFPVSRRSGTRATTSSPGTRSRHRLPPSTSPVRRR